MDSFMLSVSDPDFEKSFLDSLATNEALITINKDRTEELLQQLTDYVTECKEFAPSTKLLMKVFRVFDRHGLIRDDLCFDPEHFMETVVRFHWNDYE